LNGRRLGLGDLECRHRRRPGGVLGLCRRGGDRTLAQFLAGCFAGPGAGINVPHGAEPLFGLGQCREVTHVEAESFAAFLEAAADEKAEAFELRLFRLRERHGRRGGTQVEYERAGIRLWLALFNGIGACCGARCRVRRWCHRIFPGPMHEPATV
jgi:hypothetical protein